MNATRLESVARLLLPLGLGLAIAAGLYAFGTKHTPDYSGTALFGQTATDTLPIKSWLATGLLALVPCSSDWPCGSTAGFPASASPA